MFSKLFTQIRRHRFITGIALLVIIGGGYLVAQNLNGAAGSVQYVTATVEQGTLVLSISGSGQVSVSDQVDITPKVSGDVAFVPILQGKEVKAGSLLVQLDTRDAEQGVRDAETSLETAKLELDKLLEPPDELDLLQAENSLMQEKESKQKAEDNITKAYEDGFNIIADTFLDLPTLITGLRDILYSFEIGRSGLNTSDEWNTTILINAVESSDRYEFERFIESAKNAYEMAREEYDKVFADYKDASRYSGQDATEQLLEETREATKVIAEAVKSETNALDFWTDYRSEKDLPIFSKVAEYQSDLQSYTSKTNSHLLSLLAIQRTIEDSHDAFVNAERSIEEKELSLAQLKDGPDNLDIRAKRIEIQQKEDALFTAKQTVDDHFIRAPFDGIIAQVDAKKGNSVSSGTTLATLITKQKIAEIILNEIDVAKVKIGQLTTLSFDAVEDVTLTGKVVEIDTLGTVTLGIVTYGIKIAFDTQDERIKPGMTIDASIITERKDSIVLVPNAAVQTQGGQVFVEVMPFNSVQGRQSETPQAVPVEVGLSNELFTEIVNGLQEGDEVVTARLRGEGSTQTANVSQSFRLPGLGGGGGGFRGGGFQQH